MGVVKHVRLVKRAATLAYPKVKTVMLDVDVHAMDDTLCEDLRG